MWRKKSTPVIEFISTIPGLKNIEEIQPVPANKVVPQWWKDFPFSLDQENNSYRPFGNLVRQCPAFPDLFSSGYVLPMWADTTLYYDKDTTEYKWRCGNTSSPFVIDMLNPKQFTDNVPYTFQGSKILAVWQFTNPWNIFTSKGYSIFQLPLFYHFNDDYSVLPGTMDGFTANQNKVEVAFFSNKKEIFIKKGTPLVQYIPYKKSKVNMVIRDMTKKDTEDINQKFINRQVMFKNWYAQNRDRGTN